jgi:hypothetical protein
MLARQIAIVSDAKDQIGFRQLACVSAALQKQAMRDFGPIWGVQATVDPFDRLEDVPLGYWPILIQNDIDTSGAAGVHQDRLGQPFALVKAGPLWSLSASHECLEMLADPFGNRTIAGYAPGADTEIRAGKKAKGQLPTRVEFLVEVCDPCQCLTNAYSINGIPVSDFYTPNYFDPCKNTGVRYDFTGHIRRPTEVLKNGYLSWHNPLDGKWWHQTFFGKRLAKPMVIEGVENWTSSSMRSAVDHQVETPLETFVNRLGNREPAAYKTLFEDGGGCLGCPPPFSFSALLENSIRSGKILADGGRSLGYSKLVAGGREADEASRRDAKTLREDIDRAKLGGKA